MRKSTKSLLAILVLALIVSLLHTQANAYAKTKKITTTITNTGFFDYQLVPGMTDHVSLENAPEGTVVTWKSKRPKVATISQDGTITAVSKGNTKIICKYKTPSMKKAEVLWFRVYVIKEFKTRTFTIEEGRKGYISPQYHGSYQVTYTVEDPTLIELSKARDRIRVKALRLGETNVVISFGEYSYKVPISIVPNYQKRRKEAPKRISVSVTNDKYNSFIKVTNNNDYAVSITQIKYKSNGTLKYEYTQLFLDATSSKAIRVGSVNDQIENAEIVDIDVYNSYLRLADEVNNSVSVTKKEGSELYLDGEALIMSIDKGSNITTVRNVTFTANEYSFTITNPSDKDLELWDAHVLLYDAEGNQIGKADAKVDRYIEHNSTATATVIIPDMTTWNEHELCDGWERCERLQELFDDFYFRSETPFESRLNIDFYYGDDNPDSIIVTPVLEMSISVMR